MQSEKQIFDLQRSKDALLWEAFQFAKSMEITLKDGLDAETAINHAKISIKKFSTARFMYAISAEMLLQGEKDAV